MDEYEVIPDANQVVVVRLDKTTHDAIWEDETEDSATLALRPKRTYADEVTNAQE